MRLHVKRLLRALSLRRLFGRRGQRKGTAICQTRKVRAKPDARLPRTQHERHATVHGCNACIGLGGHNRKAVALPHTRKQKHRMTGQLEAYLHAAPWCAPRPVLIEATHRHQTATVHDRSRPEPTSRARLLERRLDARVEYELGVPRRGVKTPGKLYRLEGARCIRHKQGQLLSGIDVRHHHAWVAPRHPCRTPLLQLAQGGAQLLYDQR